MTAAYQFEAMRGSSDGDDEERSESCCEYGDDEKHGSNHGEYSGDDNHGENRHEEQNCSSYEQYGGREEDGRHEDGDDHFFKILRKNTSR